MSKEALAKVVQRAISDGAFRRQLSTDPTGALRGYDLSGDEKAAIRSGDAGRLSSLGVDQRMSKAFSIGGDAAAASRLSPSDISSTITSIDQGNDAAPNAVQKFELGGAGAPSNAIAGEAAAVKAVDAAGGGGMNAVQRFELQGAGAASNAIATGGAADTDALVSGDDTSMNAVQRFELGGAGAAGNAIATGNDAAPGDNVLDPGSVTTDHDAFAGGSTADGNALDPGAVDPTRIADDMAGGGGGGRSF